LAGNFPAVQLRGWNQNTKTKKIHYFDEKGYTPALWYVKDRTQFDLFIKNLAPFDHNSLTMDVYHSQVSKKYRQWIAEHAALSFAARGQLENALMILQEAIHKRPVNYRLWDLAAALAYTPGHEVIRTGFETMQTQYSGHSDQRLRSRIEKYADKVWQQKRMNKPGSTWNKQNIRAEVF
jgi:hypothetical protein